jgi:hypothetical protein
MMRGWRGAGGFILPLCAALLVAGAVACSAPVPQVNVPVRPPPPIMATSPDGRGAVRPTPAPTACTKNVGDSTLLASILAGAVPGDRICLTGNLAPERLAMNISGTARQPISILGDGHTTVRGISVDASYVTLSDIDAVGAAAPGISLFGDHLTLRDSTSISPRGNDGDGIRFWGTNITITHNTIRDTISLNGAHADCMQTFATDAEHPASQHVVIDGNRCEKIYNTCLIAEGPHSLAGDGSGVGVTSDIRFTNNYCENQADEALQIDDVQRMVVTGNQIVGRIDHAFAFQNKSTGARVNGNKLRRGIHYEVGMDSSSRPGYRGPEAGGDP